ncbi:hypothetical protein JCM10296v2_000992 [Rhodotorula toruloides]
MDLSAGGLAPSSTRRTPGSSARLPPGCTRFASPTARPEVSYTISDTRTETLSTTCTVHLATPPKSQQSGSGKKVKGFALPQARPLTARFSPLEAQEKVFDSAEAEWGVVELSGSESEEEMPPPKRSLAGRETGVAKAPPIVESRIARGAKRASSAGPSGEGGRTARDEGGQNGHAMSSPGLPDGSSDTETNIPTPPSGRGASSGDGQHDQLHSSSPGPSQHGDDAALARPPASQQCTKGHAQEREPHSDEGYATSSAGPSSDPFVNQSDEIEFRDISFDDDFSQTQDTQDTQESQDIQESLKRPLEAINEESVGDQNGRESKKARRSQSPELQLETPSSSQAEAEAHLLDSHRSTPQRSQSVMSVATEIDDDDERQEDQEMDDHVEGEEDQSDQQALVPVDPLASIPSLFPNAKRPFFAHAQALAQVKREGEEVQASAEMDAIKRWEEQKNKFGEQCLSLLGRVSDTLRRVQLVTRCRTQLTPTHRTNSKKVSRHQSFQATITAHSDRLSSGLGQESEAFQTMVDRLSSLWQLSGMQGTMWRRMAEMAGGAGGGEGQE